MKAAVLHEHGATPQFDDFDEPQAREDNVIVDVHAASVNHVDLLKASGGFYTGPPPLPSVVGSDGVGRLPDGRRVFFDATVVPHGSLAERALVPEEALFDVAAGVDDTVAAALGNSGLAAWLALEWKAALKPGETVLVLGATGAVGSTAVQVAKVLGAEHVIAAARRDEKLDRLRAQGADTVIELDAAEDVAAAFKRASGSGVDVIIDPLWGPTALAAMGVARQGARHVQIGHIASPTLDLPAAAVRSCALNILGFAVFHAPIDVRRTAYRRLTELAAAGDISVDLQIFSLADVGTAWEQQRQGPDAKLVITPG